jgi:hypothetical protein
MTWPLVALNDDGLRPAGEADACFYCRQRVGQPHALDCVIVKKRVRLRYLIEVDVDLPHVWDEAAILFHRNESSWCADNAVREILAHTGVGTNEQDCLCPRFTCEFVRVVDATPRRDLVDPLPASGPTH